MNKGVIMNCKIKEVWIEHEEWEGEKTDYENCNTDVKVTFKDKSTYVASFFTIKNIRELMSKDSRTGENLSGKYFWASDLIIIDDCSRESIEQVIDELIRIDDFYLMFMQVDEEGHPLAPNKHIQAIYKFKEV